MREIYLDNNATTPIDEEVLEVTVRALRDEFGNPSSAHARGARARKALDGARERVAGLLMASPAEIVFTSGGTEGNNACFAAAGHLRPDRRRVVVSAVEHPAVTNPARRLGEQGYDVREIPVDGEGELDLDAARELITSDTALVSVMAANNETGVILRMADVAHMAAARGAAVHVDAVQAVGRIPIDLPDLPVDFVTISGHKLHAPKGVGALFVRRGTSLPPLLLGGSQERGRRGGTDWARRASSTRPPTSRRWRSSGVASRGSSAGGSRDVTCTAPTRRGWPTRCPSRSSTWSRRRWSTPCRPAASSRPRARRATPARSSPPAC
jgi:cysteine desulfurase